MIKQDIIKMYCNKHISLNNIYDYCSSVESLTNFFQKVELSQSPWTIQEFCSKLLHKVYLKFKDKLIRPLKILCLRYIQVNFSCNEIHVFFLQNVYKSGLYEEALPVLLSRALPEIKIFQNYAIYGFDILFAFRYYQEAQILVENGLKACRAKNQVMKKLCKRALLIRLFLGKPGKYQDLISKLQAKEFSYLSSLKKQSDELEVKELSTYEKVSSRTPMNEEDIQLMKRDHVYQIYQGVGDHTLREHILSNVRDQQWRIKAASIKETPVGEFNTLKTVNKFGPVYKYDQEAGIMYFQYKAKTQEQLNNDITDCIRMYKSIEHAQEREENEHKYLSMH